MSQEPGGWTMCRRSQTIQDLQHQGHFSVNISTLYETNFRCKRLRTMDDVCFRSVFRAGVEAERFRGCDLEFHWHINLRLHYTALHCCRVVVRYQTVYCVRSMLRGQRLCVRHVGLRVRVCVGGWVCFGQPSHRGPYWLKEKHTDGLERV